MLLPSRAQVIRWLATAADEERLGFFVGSGFSMAATNGTAPSFKQLLERVAKLLGLPADLNTAPFLQKSYPQIASQLVAELAKTVPAAEVGPLLRRTIANLCNLAPDPDKRERFAHALESAAPSWIITTNYDLILEALLERGRTVLPNQSLFPSNTQVPIYHLHGHRYTPASIRVTEEDYVSLLAPLDYQRLKLPLLFLESTTLLLGYALGDINVRASMEWSQSFTGAKGLTLKPPQGIVVQALYRATPSLTPRVGPSGEIIIEIADIPDFLEEVGSAAREIRASNEYNLAGLSDFLGTADAPDIAEEGATRDAFLQMIAQSVGAVPLPELIAFLERATDPIWQRASEGPKAFRYYGVYLAVLLDVLEKLEYREANPNFIAYLARSLDRVGKYFTEKKQAGRAREASRRWRKEAPALNRDLLGELHSFAETNKLEGLRVLMNCSTLKPIFAERAGADESLTPPAP